MNWWVAYIAFLVTGTVWLAERKNINPHVRYLRVVLRHKFYVYRYGRQLGVKRWILIIHDLSKFSRAEWRPYVQRFGSGRAGKEDKTGDTEAFREAWLHHWQNNPHHWEYWRADGPGRGWWPMEPPIDGALEMPEAYVREMIADWRAASKVYAGKDDPTDWYNAHKDKQVMHPETRKLVERLMND